MPNQTTISLFDKEDDIVFNYTSENNSLSKTLSALIDRPGLADLYGLCFSDYSETTQEIIEDQLTGIRFDGLVLHDIHFNDVSLTNCSFIGCTMHDVTFYNCDISNTAFVNTTLYNCEFYKTTFHKSTICSLNLSDTEVIKCKLIKTPVILSLD